MNDSLNTRYVENFIDRSMQDAKALLALLADERDALSANNGELIESLAASKYRLAREIENRTQHCNQLLQQAGFDANNKGMLAYFEQCEGPDRSRLNANWQQCQDILAECQSENRVNGKLIDSSKRRIKQAISILQGQPVDEGLYGRSGNTLNPTTGSSLTRA